MKKAWCRVLLSFLIFGLFAQPVYAMEGSVLGIHILHPSEVSTAKELLSADQNKDDWHYVTVPLSLDDLHKQDEWKQFCQYAKDQKLIPVVRLMTRFQNGSWQIPAKKDIVDEITFLSALDWPTNEHYLIVFNEVNHANEWGGTIDPQKYADVLQFTSDWAKSEDKNYQVLPAAMDLAATNTGGTQEAFSYLDTMFKYNPNVFMYVDYLASHSYPNPGFSASPEANGKNSVRGFLAELSYFKAKTGRDYQVFITETGWVENGATSRWLVSYYDYVMNNVWSDPHVKAVTPFVLQGDPGPFSGFTFVNREGKPTEQYLAYQDAIKKLSLKGL